MVMGAIPNGGMIGEMLILSLFGLPVESLPILAAISTIIDPPATMLNATGDLSVSMLVERLTNGKKAA
jgi:Na+/H+-dicarboxylate symporter